MQMTRACAAQPSSWSRSQFSSRSVRVFTLWRHRSGLLSRDLSCGNNLKHLHWQQWLFSYQVVNLRKYLSSSPLLICLQSDTKIYKSFSRGVTLKIHQTYSSFAKTNENLLSSQNEPLWILLDLINQQKRLNSSRSHKNESQTSLEKQQSVPKQSSHATRILFQTIAPHVEIRTLRQLTNNLTKILSRDHNPVIATLDTVEKKRTLKRRLQRLFEKVRKEKQEHSSNEITPYSWSIKSHPWIEPIIYEYITGQYLKYSSSISSHERMTSYSNTSTISSSSSFQNHPTYPPNRNRRKYYKRLNILKEARAISFEKPFFWNEKCMQKFGYSHTTEDDKSLEDGKKLYNQELYKRYAEKSKNQLHSESEVMMELLIGRLPTPHLEKLMTALEEYAKNDEHSHLNEKNDSWFIDDDDDDDIKHHKNCAKNTKNDDQYVPLKEIVRVDPKPKRNPIFGKFLNTVSSTHSHLIAVELGLFLNVDIPTLPSSLNTDTSDDSTKKSTKDRSFNDLENKIASINTLDSIHAVFALRMHSDLNFSDKKYQKIQEDFVMKMMQLQHDFASWEDKNVLENNECSVEHENNALNKNDVLMDLKVKEFQRELVPYDIESRKQQEQALAETLVELQKMGLAKAEDLRRKPGKSTKGVHIKFTAVRVEKDVSSNESKSKESELEQRLVFIKNLPIDTTEEEIDLIYSRCGPLNSVQLFNLRPDLDPGPLTRKQMDERRRKERLRNVSKVARNSHYHHKHRPCTPVYGILTFQTAEGYSLAASPEMSLFGCIIRRHAVMSIKPRDMKTLYLENIPTDLYSIDVEYKLALLFHPHNMHIMRDGMKGIGDGRKYYSKSDRVDDQTDSEPASCEINFEDFQSANKTYHLLRGDIAVDASVKNRCSTTSMGGDDCQVHWFRTPPDAQKYWTRELIF